MTRDYNVTNINLEERYISSVNIRKSKKSHKQRKVESTQSLELYRCEKGSKFVKRVVHNTKKKFNIHRYDEPYLPNFEQIESGKGYVSEGIYLIPGDQMDDDDWSWEDFWSCDDDYPYDDYDGYY